jgi:hypothetical protein
MNSRAISASVAAILTAVVVLLALVADTGEVDVGEIQTDVSSILTVGVDPTIDSGVPTVTATAEPRHCIVIVGQDPFGEFESNGLPVWAYWDDNGKPGTVARIQIPYGTDVVVTHFWVIEDVTNEWSWAPEWGGWVPNGVNFPAYNYPACWDVSTDRPAPTPTPMPTATPLPVSPTPIPALCQVTPDAGKDYVNLRADPGTWAVIVGRLEEGDRATVLREDNAWYELEDGAWVASWVVEESPGCEQIPGS